MNYDLLKNDNTQMARTYCKAINKALKDTEKLENGQDRIKAIQMVYLDKTHTVSGVACEMYYGERTVFRWLNSFIYAVGHNVGF